jgi:hypothetical protein
MKTTSKRLDSEWRVYNEEKNLAKIIISNIGALTVRNKLPTAPKKFKFSKIMQKERRKSYKFTIFNPVPLKRESKFNQTRNIISLYA